MSASKLRENSEEVWKSTNLPSVTKTLLNYEYYYVTSILGKIEYFRDLQLYLYPFPGSSVNVCASDNKSWLYGHGHCNVKIMKVNSASSHTYLYL